MGIPANTDHLGTDFAFDDDGDLMVTPTGDVALVAGTDCLLKDVQDQLRTVPGDLWKHSAYGCSTNLLLGAQDTALNRALAQRGIRLALEQEPRINPKTIRIDPDQFTADEKTFQVHFRAKGADVEQKLVVGFGLESMDEVTDA